MSVKKFSFGIALVALFAQSAPVLAQPLVVPGSANSRSSVYKSQTKLLDGRLAKQYSGSSKLAPKSKTSEAGEDEGVNALRYSGKYRGQYLEHARGLARKHGVPEALFLRLVQRESGWNPTAVSVKGATGLAQLMPDTAKSLGVRIDDPHENLEGGARYLKMMYNRFGSWRLALAAYNAGPGAVEKHGGVPPYAETTAYVQAILN